MAAERKKLNILKRMNEKIGVMKAVNYFPRYVEERAYNVNEVISQRRKLLGLTQEELAWGVCDVKTVSRLENKRTNLQRKYRETLLQRVKMSGDKYIAYVDHSLGARPGSSKRVKRWLSVYVSRRNDSDVFRRER